MSLMGEKELTEQLILLKGITNMTGVLHEAQVLQLQLYPLMVYEKGTSSVAEVDFEKRAIKFKVTVLETPPDEQHKKAVAQLVDWVRWLLWDHASVSVEFILPKGKSNGSSRKARVSATNPRRKTTT